MRNPLPLTLLLILSLNLSLFAQHIIIPEPPMPRPQPGLFELELKQLSAEVSVENGAAVTRLEQVFFNPTRHQLQGYFMMPVPKDVAVSSFSMWVNGKEMKGELLDAEKAKKIYEDIVRKHLDPALLEYQGQGLLRLKVFPIQPQSEQRIVLEYQHTLGEMAGLRHYRLPLPRSSEKPLPQLVLKADIRSGQSLKSVFCPTHDMEVKRDKDTEARLVYEGEQVQISSDWEFFFQEDIEELAAGLLTHPTDTEGGFFMLNLSPGLAESAPLVEKDVVFILDASGSMSGEKIEQARRTLAFCVNQLGEGDRYNIVRFSTEARPLFPQLQPADAAAQKATDAFLDDLDAIGGTNVEEAFQVGFAQQEPDSRRPFFVIFLTDGKPTIGERDQDKLLQQINLENKQSVRVFTVGIGTEVNTRLLDELTYRTGGYRTYVLPEEDIEVKVSDFYQKLAHPVLSNLSWNLEGEDIKWMEVYPKQLPDLFRGQTLTVFGQYQGVGEAELVVNGYLNEEKKTFRFPIAISAESESYNFIPALWATRAVGYLLEQIRLHGESEEVVAEIVRLAKEYGIITPYTSYLILEDEELLIGQGRLENDRSLLRQRINRTTLEQNKQIYSDAMEEEYGEAPVRASDDIQKLNQSSNLGAAKQSLERLDMPLDLDQQDQLYGNIRQVNGRAFYQNQSKWMDGRLANLSGKENPRQQITFNSKAYFELLDNYPELGPILALGQEVEFVWQGAVYEITLQ
jgi:Ca-activated chloride channel family protein